MATLSLKHIYKIYDNGTKAVNDFNLEIGENEFIVFVGPSGCGKSTTLRMIAGLEDITAGDFYIDGILANNLEPKDRDMAMVFQNYALYPHMNVFENMAFGLRIKHVPKDEIQQRIHEAAKILDIENQLAKKPKEMSGGQRQRVALGRAIVRKPKVFLLDEPLSNLDAKLRSSMRSEITRLHNVLKTTFIYVTHDQVEAMTMGTRIVVMENGVIKQVDTPMNLYDYPENIFVAGFIGTPQMNFYKGKLGFEGKDIVIFSEFKDIKVNLDTINHINILNVINQKEVTIGVRPEHVLLCEENDENAIEVEVAVVEALGNESNIIVETIKDRTKFVIRTKRCDDIAINQKLYIKIDLSKIHIFDDETSQTLLERNPHSFTLKAKVIDNSHLEILNKKLEITPYIYEALKDEKEVLVNVSQDAIIEGKTFEPTFINKEKVGENWLYSLKNNEEYLFYSSKDYIDGTKFNFDLSLSKLSFYKTSGELLLDKFNSLNEIKGTLEKCKKELPVLGKNLIEEEVYENLKNNNFTDSDGKKIKAKIKNVNVFNYKMFGEIIEPLNNHVIKAYSLLGKRFAEHHISFTIDASDFVIKEDGLFKGQIENIIDYKDVKYFSVKVGEAKILINANNNELEVGQIINFDCKKEKIGLISNDFGVKLI